MDSGLLTTLVQALQITVATSLVFIGGTYEKIAVYNSGIRGFGVLVLKTLGLRTVAANKYQVSQLTLSPGLSSCLSLWVIPLTALLPPRLAVDQFNQTVTWGFHYLQPSSRILAFSLLTTTILTAYLSDVAHAHAWKYWAAALVTLVPVAPYEVYMIFPINDKVRDIGKRLDRQGKDETGEKEAKRELRVLFKKWQFRNFGRVAMPLLAGVVGWLGIVRL